MITCCFFTSWFVLMTRCRLPTPAVFARRPKNHDGSIPNKAYYYFSNVKIENGGVSYYHSADQPPPPDAPSQCVVLSRRTSLWNCTVDCSNGCMEFLGAVGLIAASDRAKLCQAHASRL